MDEKPVATLYLNLAVADGGEVADRISEIISNAVSRAIDEIGRLPIEVELTATDTPPCN